MCCKYLFLGKIATTVIGFFTTMLLLRDNIAQALSLIVMEINLSTFISVPQLYKYSSEFPLLLFGHSYKWTNVYIQEKAGGYRGWLLLLFGVGGAVGLPQWLSSTINCRNLNAMYLIPPNYPFKNGSKGTFCSLHILSYLEKQVILKVKLLSLGENVIQGLFYPSMLAQWNSWNCCFCGCKMVDYQEFQTDQPT